MFNWSRTYVRWHMNICSEALEHMFIFQVCFFTIFWSEKSVVDYAVSVLSAVEGSQSFTDGLYAILRSPYSALPHRPYLKIKLESCLTFKYH